MRGEKVRRLTWHAPDGGVLCENKDAAIERLYILENILGDERFEYEPNKLARLADLEDFLRMITNGDMFMLNRLKELWHCDKEGRVFVGTDRGGDPGTKGQEGYIPTCDHIAGAITHYDYFELANVERISKYVRENSWLAEPYKNIRYWAEHVDYEDGEIILFSFCPKCGEAVDWGAEIKAEEEGEQAKGERAK